MPYEAQGPLQPQPQAAADQEWELRLIKQSAQAKIDADDFAAAIPLLQQIVARRPDVPANHVNLGLVLEHALGGEPEPQHLYRLTEVGMKVKAALPAE